MDPVAARWRDLLLETIEPHKDLPLLMSGGTDSATLLAAQLTLGARPSLYSFRLGTSDNRDVAVSRKIAHDHDLELHVLDLPNTTEDLVRDVYEVIGILRTARKTSVQCAQPIMHLCRQIAEDGHDSALVGTGAVCLDDRRVYTILHQEGEDAARAYRADKLNDRYTDCGTGRMHEMALHCGVRLEEPYSDEPLRSYALGLDMAELNYPKQKGVALRAFPEFWKRGYYRQNASLQVASGVREWHETLIKSPLNKRGAQRVVAIYNDVLQEVKTGALAEPR